MKNCQVVVNLLKGEDENETFYSCETFSAEEAEDLRQSVLRQINSVLIGEKESVVIPFYSFSGSEASCTVIPGDLLKQCVVEIDVCEDDLDDHIPLLN